jgi:hypothetical protein
LRRLSALGILALCGILPTTAWLHAQEKPTVELRLRIVSSLGGKHRAVPAVIWLDPMPGTAVAPFDPRGHYALLQKSRTFLPHLQIIPVGAVVTFPNGDPFFHNVFSLFDGKRFNLGLYEAGSSRSVTFTRAGVSYIFCNIHPEMSAVIIALNTPLYAIADAKDTLALRDVPPGNYTLHIWIEGVPQSFLDRLNRQLRLAAGIVDLGTDGAPIAPIGAGSHMNIYGKAYALGSESPYSDLP